MSRARSGLKLVTFKLQAQMVTPKPDAKEKAKATGKDETPAEPVAS